MYISQKPQVIAPVTPEPRHDAPASTSRHPGQIPESDDRPASGAGLARSTGSVVSRQAAMPVTVETSKLDRVSDPRLEVKKEASAPNGMYLVSYSVPGSGQGVSNITFPISIGAGTQRTSSEPAGIYYAMQFGINDEQGNFLGGGYIGLQPREDGKARVPFSGFGSHFTAPHGSSDADGGPGASNSTAVDFKFGHKYNLTVEQDPKNPLRLSGYIQDVTDPEKLGPKQHVKDLYVDRKVSLTTRFSGFVEHYGKEIDRSSQIAPTAGSFSAPFTTDDQGNIKVGSVQSDGLYGRFRNSITGDLEVTRMNGEGKELKFSFQGVGYQKPS
ncbi:hypothetical protein [Pseudomonas sp. R3-18-08]|uniref:hypothetical protein n=1 Tax=Pseudomonas sp. R3-18-08 TaxID=1173283 RepID=UPI002115A24D|nr:hypothetical protein [Pseudomonas sp. R3-18-08]